MNAPVIVRPIHAEHTRLMRERVRVHRSPIERAPVPDIRSLPGYGVWSGMKNRCNNPKNKNYKQYGARGITVCERWSCAEGYRNFVSDMGPRPSGMTLERNDSNGNYCPENCRWATQAEQCANTSRNVFIEHNGVRLHISGWARRLGISVKSFDSRVRQMGPERAITQPFTPRGPRAK